MGINIIYRWHDHTPERLAMAKSALDRALALDPDHPEVHLAHGCYYYFGFRDWEPALEQLALALQSQPNNSDLIMAIGYVQRRQGQWDAAAANLRKAAELDPRSYLTSLLAATTYLYMRNWAKAERYADQFILMWPEHWAGYALKAFNYIQKGDIEKARKVDRKSTNTRSYIEILGRDYQKALDIVEASASDWFLRKAHIYRYMGRHDQAATYYDSARVTYEKQVRKDPDDYEAHENLGIAYAGLGRREEAIREGKLAVEILPLSKDAFTGTDRILQLAIIYTILGEQDAAIDQLEVLLSIPSYITVPILKLDPTWDPLREHPRFKALVSGGLP